MDKENIIPLLCSEQKFENCEAYYKQQTNNIFKCVTKDYCVNILNYKYFVKNECRDNCNGYYQREYTESSSLKYFICYETLNEALIDVNVNYCDKHQKKCWKDFPNDFNYYINSEFSPPNFKYELVRECEKFYYLKTDFPTTGVNSYRCVNDCKNIPNSLVEFFFESGNKECFDSCSKFHKYYYNDENNQCLDSCTDLPNKKFSYPIVGTFPEKWLPSCDNSNDN